MSHGSYIYYTIILNNWFGYDNDYSSLLIWLNFRIAMEIDFWVSWRVYRKVNWGLMTYPDVAVTIPQAGTTGCNKVTWAKSVSVSASIQTLDTMWPAASCFSYYAFRDKSFLPQGVVFGLRYIVITIRKSTYVVYLEDLWVVLTHFCERGKEKLRQVYFGIDYRNTSSSLIVCAERTWKFVNCWDGC